MFGETLVPTSDLTEILGRPGLKEAYGRRDQIDIVVTAMGDFTDPHDLLKTFLQEAGVPVGKSWVGNVQYRPYDETGPVSEGPNDLRALTLFDLDDFREMAALKNRHVVLLARQCGLCERTRAAHSDWRFQPGR